VAVSVREIASWIDGEIVGDADTFVSRVRPLSQAAAGDLTFLDSDRHLPEWLQSPAAAAIVPRSVGVNGRPIIRVDDPLMAFAHVMKRLRGANASENTGIHPSAVIASTAEIAADASIGPFVVVGEESIIGAGSVIHSGVSIGRHCAIGASCVLHPHVALYDDTVLGDRVIIHANAVIGADGYGYRVQAGKHVKVPQLGSVEIENDVEIGANSTIDRGTFGATRIGAGTKIDNLVMIGHNCTIGRHNLIVAQAGFAGSCTTGDYVVIAGQAGVADHLTIGARTMIGPQSGILRDVPADARMMGMPLMPDRDTIRLYRNLTRLNELFQDVRKLKAAAGFKEAA
jgi:UDP-3-O-[3-hydroxymyristoyl] glucosamine N-acyltransferase